MACDRAQHYFKWSSGDAQRSPRTQPCYGPPCCLNAQQRSLNQLIVCCIRRSLFLDFLNCETAQGQRMYKYILILAAALFAFASTHAEAARVQRTNTVCIPTDDIMHPCAYNPNFLQGVRSIKVTMKRERVSALTPERPRRARYGRRHQSYEPVQPYRTPVFTQVARTVVGAVERVASVATQFLPHPAGCPRSAFCGCATAVEVFGTSQRRDLWLAANWLKFPKTTPAPGMVAARHGHVFTLKQQLPNGAWLVADYNSGGGKSRLHVRSLSGYTIVNPHG